MLPWYPHTEINTNKTNKYYYTLKSKRQIIDVRLKAMLILRQKPKSCRAK